MGIPDAGQDDIAQTEKSGLMSGLTKKQKIIVAAIVGGVFIVLILLIVSSSSKDYAVLYSGLSVEDAGRIVEHLKESGVKYRLTSGGHTIEVPEDRVYELRMELAAKGFPQGAGAGFELFDKTSLGATEFTQKVNYTRALQNELARTIMTLTPVDQARVHIVIPEERLFSEQQKPTTASIVLQMKPGAYLLDAQVRGVVHLASSAVQGLTPENVTVLDTDGNLLWRASTAESTAGPMTTAQLEAKMGFEQEMQRRIETMLDRAFGLGKSIVRVYADINFDSAERASEIYQPLEGGLGIPVAVQTTQEERVGDSDAARGYAGTPSNVEGYPVLSGTGSGESRYTRSESTTNYEVSKVVQKEIIAPGKVERVSVAVMLDRVMPMDRMEEMRQVISAAVGIQPERGDQIAITTMEFARAASEDEMFASAESLAKADKQAFIMRLVKSLTPLILGLLVLLFAMSFLRVFREQQEYATEPAIVGRKVDEVLAEEASPEPLSPAALAALAEEKQKAEMRQGIEALARKKPGDVARILETWMSED